ncbi:hypothetical protein FQB35_02265 [Crassaminicella thermophila]|uniref:Uncharacterized protein n=1 Tax=Crassaminicella thermophila TaxID=2599308 RepID=A0A5C0S9E2_CRATE|nr:hypothetical protein [Crassaminicella thermophila]QEK11285.1 hypothetical protein FQB35_02265 [Crassaminicella thermophila]
MEEINREELNLETTDIEVLDIKDLEQLKDKEKSSRALSDMISSLLSNDKILSIILFTLLRREEEKAVKPYWGDKLKEVIVKAENILDIMYALNNYAKNQAEFGSQLAAKNKTMELLEVIRPHVHGRGRQKIDQALAVNDRINRLKENSKKNRNVIQDFENIADILEILELNEGYEMKRFLDKAKRIMEILRK